MSVPQFIGEKKWSSNPLVRKFVVSGCGRSGTLYMTKVLDILGFEVGHEGVLKNGTSSWYLTEKSHADYIKKAFEGHDVTYIHIVRNPLNVITSMWQCENLKNRMALRFVRDHYPNFDQIQSLEAVIKWWIFWNMQTSSNFPINVTLPIEQLQMPDALHNFCKQIKVKYTPKKFQKIKALGTKTHAIRGLLKASLQKTFGPAILRPKTFEDIQMECGKGLAFLLKTFAKNYGYEL